MLPPNIRSRIHLSKNTRACVHAESGGFVFIDAAFTALPHSLALKETLRLFPSMKQIFLKRVAWLARAGRDATRAQASIPCGTCEVGLSGFAKNNCPVPARYGRLRAECGAAPTSIVSGLAQREVSRAIGRASCTNPPLSDSDRGGLVLDTFGICLWREQGRRAAPREKSVGRCARKWGVEERKDGVDVELRDFV